METIDLGIKFVRGWEPAPPTPEPVPGSGTDVAGVVAQTGDFNIALIAGLVLLTMTIAGVVAYAFAKNRQFAGASHVSQSSFKLLNFSNFSLPAKIISAVAGFVAVICIVCGCFSMNAHAVDEQSSLVPDKTTITATVAEDGSITLDTCTLTNNGTKGCTVEKSVVSIVQEFAEIEGLENAEITITGFKGKLFEGNPGVDYTPKDLQDLDTGDSTILSFVITLPEDFDIETLFDKQVFSLSLTPKIIFTPDPVTNINYQVCIWGFGQDQVGEGGAETASITFGPATGETNACLDVDGHESHSLGKHCIHEDSWDEIIYNINNGHADYYSECLAAGCTKSVPIALNNDIGTMPINKELCSILQQTNKSGHLLDKYVKWNNSYSDSDCESANWATSRIRATLNGGENQTLSSYAGDDCLSTTNCLLSCFPTALANAIKPKYYTVPKNWSTIGDDYNIESTETVSDKLWLMSGEEVYGQTEIPSYFKESEKVQYTKKQNEGTTWKVYSKNKAYVWSPSGVRSGSRWLRSPYRGHRWGAGSVYTNGAWDGIHVDSTGYGLSPCFCL